MKKQIAVTICIIALLAGIGYHVHNMINKKRINSIKLTDMFDCNLTKEPERFDLEFYKNNCPVEEWNCFRKTFPSGLHVEINDGLGYILNLTLRNSYFTLHRRYYSNGIIRQKGWRFYAGDFAKGVWYFYDEKGRLIEERDYDAPFLFTLEDVLAFCKKEHFEIFPANLVNEEIERSPTSISRRHYFDKDGKEHCLWDIDHLRSGTIKKDEIVLDGKTGKIVSWKVVDVFP